MEPGRALDTMIAERVMGWKVFAGEPGYGKPPGSPVSLVLDPIPHYSTDIAAARLVVEKVKAGQPYNSDRYTDPYTICLNALEEVSR